MIKVKRDLRPAPKGTERKKKVEGKIIDGNRTAA